jgi:hypothetical protein
MNQIAAAGERTLIVRRRFSSIPLVFDINVTSAEGGLPTGSLEKVGSRWIFGRTRELIPLAARHRIAKGFWDTLFDVYLIPDRAVAVTVARKRTAHRLNLGRLAAIVLGVAVVIYWLTSAS